MKLPIVVAAGLALYGVALAQEGPAFTPMSLQTALAAKPAGPKPSGSPNASGRTSAAARSLVKGGAAEDRRPDSSPGRSKRRSCRRTRRRRASCRDAGASRCRS